MSENRFFQKSGPYKLKELSTSYLSGLKNNSTLSISESAVLEKNVIIEKGAVIGDRVKIGKNSFIAVSYTHLTLPTICSV